MTIETLQEMRAMVSTGRFTRSYALELMIRWNGAGESFLEAGDEQKASLCFDIANIVELRMEG